MSPNARILVASLIAAIIVAGLAAIYLTWEQEGDDAGELGSVASFIARSDASPAPEISFQDGEHAKRTLADFHGQIVVVNFWATWCAPCIRELPSLDRLAARLKDKGVTIIALSLDRGGVDAVKAFYAENGIHNLEVFVDKTMDAQQKFDIPGLPTTVLIDREGHDRGRLIGPANWDTDAASDLVLSAK